MGPRLAAPMAEGTVERTLVLVKPDGVRRGLVGEIVGRLERKQLRIVAAKLTAVSSSTAETHYGEHKGKPFYPGLVAHISSAPVFAMVLEGRSAISVVRLLTGATNPQAAAPGDGPGRPRPRRHAEPDPRVRLAGVRRTGDRTVLPARGVPRVYPNRRGVRLNP